MAVRNVWYPLVISYFTAAGESINVCIDGPKNIGKNAL
jgi:hypothetical protein